MDTLKNFLDFQYETIDTLSEKKKIYLVKDKLSGQILVKREVALAMSDIYNKLKLIQHKNLVQVLEVHPSQNVCIVIEEFVNGIKLSTLLKKKGAFSHEIAIQYTKALCEALKQMHQKSLTHRDVNPDNIRITVNGTLKLMDFDAAKIIKGTQSHDTVLLGTVNYAAPEQFGFYESDNRTDIYATGVLLNQMLTGKLPNESLYVEKKHLAHIIKNCLQIDKNKRYQRIEQVSQALERPQGYYLQKLYRQLPGLRTDKWPYKILSSIGYLFVVMLATIEIEELSYSVHSPLDLFIATIIVLTYIFIPAALFSNVGDIDAKLFKLSGLPHFIRIVFRWLLGLVIPLFGSFLSMIFFEPMN